MKIEDYIFTQTKLNQALHADPENTVDFALFAAIFSDQIDTLREHIEPDQALPATDFFEGIHTNTQTRYHLVTEDTDYLTAQALNKAICNQQLAYFNFMICANTHPLSMHNDAAHLDEGVLSNCSFATQQGFKRNPSNAFFDIEDCIKHQQPSLLNDIIQQTHEKFQSL